LHERGQIQINVAIIGCGNIGHKRAQAIKSFIKISACFDIDLEVSRNFALVHDTKAVNSLNDIFSDNNIEIVIISTRHDSLTDISMAAIDSGKHVFVEKPAAINSKDFELVLKALSKKRKMKFHVGYNHRYHPSILEASKFTEAKEFGELMFLRARYGHGGRIGYEHEWRSKKEISGGGELIDQGSHLLDLCLMFLGNISLEYAATPNYFWKSPVEDNAFIVVKNEVGAIGFLHASCTEWKNMFSLELYFEKCKLDINGLGGSYGPESLTIHKMSKKMGPPDSVKMEFEGNDDSWEIEFQIFLNDIIQDSNLSDNVQSSKKVLEIISEVYDRSGR
jgi:predicted dehydrogenase